MGCRSAKRQAVVWLGVARIIPIQAGSRVLRTFSEKSRACRPWDVVQLPAIAEEDELYRAATVFGGNPSAASRARSYIPSASRVKCSSRSAGRSPSTIFAGQYQPASSRQGGGMAKAAWFKSYGENERPDKFDRIRLCPSAQGGGVARRIPARADGFPERQAR